MPGTIDWLWLIPVSAVMFGLGMVFYDALLEAMDEETKKWWHIWKRKR